MTIETIGLNAAAEGITSNVTHIGLVDETGTELAGGSYARLAVVWSGATTGTDNPNADLTFDVPGGNTVGGWRGFDAVSAGNNYGGEDVTQEVFAGDGTYTLTAAQTGYRAQNPA